MNSNKPKKSMKKLLYVFALFVTPFFIACEEEGAYDDENDVDGEAWMEERDEYRTETEREIEEYEVYVRDYDTTGLDDDSRAEWREFKADFNRQLDSVRADLDRAGETTKDEWDEFKADVDDGVNELEREWNEFKAKFDDKDKK